MAREGPVQADAQHGVGDGPVGNRGHLSQIVHLHPESAEGLLQHADVDRHPVRLRSVGVMAEGQPVEHRADELGEDQREGERVTGTPFR